MVKVWRRGSVAGAGLGGAGLGDANGRGEYPGGEEAGFLVAVQAGLADCVGDKVARQQMDAKQSWR